MFGFSHIFEIWVFVGLGVMVILFLMSAMARLYRKAGPHEALIVYGLGGTRVVKGHGTLVFPMVQICRELSLELTETRQFSNGNVFLRYLAAR